MGVGRGRDGPFVKETRGFDFTGYKRSTIERRVAKRMAEVGVTRYEDYLDHLELHGEEFAELFNTILITVTSFFRDWPAWEYLATEALPQLPYGRNVPPRLTELWGKATPRGRTATATLPWPPVLSYSGRRETDLSPSLPLASRLGSGTLDSNSAQRRRIPSAGVR